MAKQAATVFKKPFFFIRTKVSYDLQNTERDLNYVGRGDEFNEEETLKKMRDNCYVNLKELLASDKDIFLIDNNEPHKWDFERLINAIPDVLPERRRECFILSLTNLTRDLLKRKAAVLKGISIHIYDVVRR